MKTLVLSIIFSISLSQSYNKHNLKELSFAISKTQLKDKIRKGGKDYYHAIRVKLIGIGKLNNFSNSDTLFILETYDYESSIFYGKIWNSKNEVNYKYKLGKFVFTDEKIFTKITCKLIEDWDIKRIKKEEKENSSMIPSFIITGTRVIDKDSIRKITCTKFKEFFLLERDR